METTITDFKGGNMTLSDYINNLKKQVIANPEMLDLPIVYSSDDEGNQFHKVVYMATVGNYREDDNEYDTDGSTKNAVCIN